LLNLACPDSNLQSNTLKRLGRVKEASEVPCAFCENPEVAFTGVGLDN
jgi:hypothetical protein